RWRRRRKGDDLLVEEVHEEEQRLRLEDEQNRLILRVVVEVLMNAAVLDDHRVAGLPLDAPPVVDIMAAALEDVEDGAVEMPVLLAVSAGGVDLDMRLDRLRHLR